MASDRRSKILVILGPTATGKTDLALQLASRFQGELVSCDSRQVYKGLDIGTGKLPSSKFKIQSSKLKKQNGFWEMNGIKVWMYDVVESNKQYSVADYVGDANKVIDEILGKGKLPIIVGGSGLYLKALLEGLPSLAVPMDQKLRVELGKLSLQKLQKRLQKLSSQKWEKMNNSDRQNPRRLIRAVEIASLVDINTTAVGFMSTGAKALFQRGIFQRGILKIGLTAPRKILYDKADQRVMDRINQGMIEEAKNLHKKGITIARMKQLGLEYGVLADYLSGHIKTEKELTKILQGKIHGFIRRQLTWFKKEENVHWFNVNDENFPRSVEKLVSIWYHQA